MRLISGFLPIWIVADPSGTVNASGAQRAAGIHSQVDTAGSCMTLKTPFYITTREPGFIAVRDADLRPVAAFVDQETADAFVDWANCVQNRKDSEDAPTEDVQNRTSNP